MAVVFACTTSGKKIKMFILNKLAHYYPSLAKNMLCTPYRSVVKKSEDLKFYLLRLLSRPDLNTMDEGCYTIASNLNK